MIVCLVLLLSSISMHAQDSSPVSFTVRQEQISEKEIQVIFESEIAAGWHVYSTDMPDGGPISASVTVESAKGASADGKLQFAGEEVTAYDSMFGMEVRYFDELYWAVIGGTPMNDGLMREIFRPSYEVLGLNVDGAADAPEGEEKEDEDVMPLMRDMMRSWRTFVQAHIQYPCGQVLFLLTPQPGIKAPEEIMLLAAQRIKKRQEQAERALGNVVKEGDMMVDFEGSTLAGEPFKLSEEVGRHKLLMLDFWASWCGPCMKELPNVAAVYNDFKDKGLQVIGVSIDKNEADWRQALEEEQLPYLQLHDPNSATQRLYNFDGIPFIILISPDGILLERELFGDEIRKAVEKHVK